MVSQTAEYALHAVLYLAHHGGGPAVAQDIAEATGVPKGYLHKILRRLGKAGILGSQRGVGGGYLLLRTAEQITVLEIIEATDLSKARPSAQLLAGDPDPVHKLIDRAARKVSEVFGATTVQILIDSEETPGVRASA